MNATASASTRRQRPAGFVLSAAFLVLSCGGPVEPTLSAPAATPAATRGGSPLASPQACLTAAAAYQGSVAATFASNVGAIRILPAVANNPQLNSFEPTQPATVCYIDGEIGKAPPPPADGTVPPPFDRAVVVVVGDRQIIVAAGYRESVPIQAP